MLAGPLAVGALLRRKPAASCGALPIARLPSRRSVDYARRIAGPAPASRHRRPPTSNAGCLTLYPPVTPNTQRYFIRYHLPTTSDPRTASVPPYAPPCPPRSPGDLNTGINEYSFNFQSNYTFSTGRLKGFGVFTSLRTFARNRAYYTQVFPAGSTGSAVQADRVLYRLPGTTIVDLNLSYRRKLRGGVEWSTQLNVNNVLDQSEVTVLPNPANAAQPRARLSAQPRQFIWTNTFRF